MRKVMEREKEKSGKMKKIIINFIEKLSFFHPYAYSFLSCPQIVASLSLPGVSP